MLMRPSDSLSIVKKLGWIVDYSSADSNAFN